MNGAADVASHILPGVTCRGKSSRERVLLPRTGYHHLGEWLQEGFAQYSCG